MELKHKIMNNKNLLQTITTLSSLIILCIFFGITTKVFFTADNLLTVALQIAIIAILALGETFVIISGGIDLSVSSVIGLSGVICSLLMTSGVSIGVALLLTIVLGLVIGFINGFITVKGNIPPFITTLGMMSIARGLALIITNGIPISNLPKSFEFIGSGKIVGIPVPVIVMFLLAIIFGIILAKTPLGRYTYAIGSNLEAAKLAGIDTNKYQIIIYSLSGMLASIAGIIFAARVISGQPTAGIGYELDAIASVVIGGASMMGGEGTIVGTIIGAFIMGVLKNGLNLLNVSAFWQQVVIGVVIIGAVYLDRIRRK